MVTAALVVAVPGSDRAYAAGEAGNWVLMDDRGLITTRFGSAGNVYITGVQAGGGFIPASDFYVVQNRDWSTVPEGTSFEGLDVSNPTRTPNTYLGWQVVQEPLWFGTLRVGGYDVIVDRDQDGVISAADEIIGYGAAPGFTVTFNGTLSELEKAALKQEHGARWGLAAATASIGADVLEARSTAGDAGDLVSLGFDVLNAVEFGEDRDYYKLIRSGTSLGVGIMTDAACELLSEDGIENEMCFTMQAIAHGPLGVGVMVGTQELKKASENLRAAAEAIYLDPPDFDYDTVDPYLAPEELVDESSADPVVSGLARLSNRMSEAAAWSKALLHAIERHDGAAIEGNRDAMRLQAAAVAEFSDGLSSALREVQTAAQDTAVAFSEAGLDEDYALLVPQLEELKDRLASTGFSAEELAQFAEAGVSEQSIDEARAAILSLETPEGGYAAVFAQVIQDVAPSRDVLWALSYQALNIIDAIDDGVGANQPPVAEDDYYVARAGASITFWPLENDLDPEGEALTFEIQTEPARGELECATDGTCTYAAPAGFEGTDSFTYFARDPSGLTAAATVTIKVSASGLVAQDDHVTVSPGGTIIFDVLQNDLSDQHFWIIGSTDAASGTASCELHGSTCRYSAPSEIGTDSFEYTIQNSNDDRSTATVHVAIDGSGAPPVVFFQVDDVTTAEGTAPNLPYVAYDPDGEIVSYAWSTTNGLAAEGPWPPTPQDDGPDTYTLTVTDDSGAFASASIDVIVTNEDPVVGGFSIPTRSPIGATVSYWADVTDPGPLDEPRAVWVFHGMDQLSGSNVEYTWPVAGQYEVSLFGEDKDGARSLPVTVTVDVEDTRVDAGSDRDTVEGGTVDFDFSSSTPADDHLSYVVDFGDGSDPESVSELSSVRHTYEVTGTYTVTLTATDTIDTAGERRASDRATVTVENVAPSILGVARSVTAPGESTALRVFWDDPGGNDGAVVTWDLGEGATATGQSIDHLFPGTGEYAVTVTVVDRFGASTTKDILVDAGSAAVPSRSSTGRDFWLAFDANHVLGDVSQDETRYLRLFVSGTPGTSGEVRVPGIGFDTEFTLNGSGLVSVDVALDALVGMDHGAAELRVEPRAVQVVTDGDVTVYGLNRMIYTTDAFLALPSTAAGYRYRILDYASFNSGLLSVVATAGTTTVRVEPTPESGLAPFEETLELGDVLEWEPAGAHSLTGALVTTDRPAIVSAGNRCTNVPVGAFYCDHIIEQMHPTATWGKTFVTYPLHTRSQDTFRIVADADGTLVSITRASGDEDFALNAGDYREFLSGEPMSITASEPIAVAQYSNGSTFDSTVSDPFMALVPPFEQGFTESTFATPLEGFTNYVNITARTDTLDGVTLDGEPIDAALWQSIPGSSFSGVAVEIEPGTHTVRADRAIQTLVYGFGADDSYGYPGGTRVAEIARATTLSLAPRESTILAGVQQCVTASFIAEDGSGIVGARVDFVVSGSVSREESIPTAAGGRAMICVASEEAGTAEVRAAVGELEDAALITWTHDEQPPTNVAPVAAISVTGDRLEGETIVLDAGLSFDANGDALSFVWDADDDGVFDSGTGSSLSLPLPVAGEYPVTVRVSDGRGGVDELRTVVTAANVVPAVILGDDIGIEYGEEFVLRGRFVDPGADTWTATVDYGDGSGEAVLVLDGKEFALLHSGYTPGDYLVKVAVSDTIGRSVGTGTVRIHVAEGVLETVVPSIVGTPVVDGALSVDAGDWGPAPVDLGYQWAVDGVPVDGATAERYVVAPGDLGRRITVTTAGSKPGYREASETSSPTAAVQPGQLDPAVPVIQGEPRVGETLLAEVADWGPSPVDLGYQWAADGVNVVGANGASFVPSSAETGKEITVSVTGTKLGYSTQSRISEPAGPVEAASEAVQELVPGLPTISGAPVVGSPLVGDPGRWGPSPVDLAFQWLVDGVPVSGAANREFVPSAEHVGSSVTLLVRGSRIGYEPQQAVSSAVGPIELGKIIGQTPVISGSPQSGGVLTVLTGSWSPEPLDFAYQWTADGDPIPDANGSNLLLIEEYVGAHIAVSVTASRAGYRSVTLDSDGVRIDDVPKTNLPTESGSGTQPGVTDSSRELSRTGGQVAPILPLAMSLILFGVAALFVSRRRRRGL